MIFEPAKLLPASTKVGKLPRKQRGVNCKVEIPVSCLFRNKCVTVTVTTKYHDQGMVFFFFFLEELNHGNTRSRNDQNKRKAVYNGHNRICNGGEIPS